MCRPGRGSPEADDASGQVRGRASDAGLGSGERDGGILPVLSRPLLDQTIVLHLGGGGGERGREGERERGREGERERGREGR